MIVKLIISPFLLIIKGVIVLLPVLQAPASGFAGLFNLMTTALNFFPAETWLLCIGSIVFWLSVQFVLAIFHFIAGLIPLLDIRIS